jgi:hypothetical protein
MKQTVNLPAFMDAFHAYKRYGQFDYNALQILFEYLEELESETGEEIELDVIALCCDYSVDSVADIASNYDIDLSDCEDDEARKFAVLEYLNDNTSVCGDFEDADTGTRYIVYGTAF